jgi:hypothetical protein
VNPGSAGPRRFSLPRTASVLVVEERRLEVRWYELAPGGARERAAPLAVDLDAPPRGDPR